MMSVATEGQFDPGVLQDLLQAMNLTNAVPVQIGARPGQIA
jgi:hypothetical protein